MARWFQGLENGKPMLSARSSTKAVISFSQNARVLKKEKKEKEVAMKTFSEWNLNGMQDSEGLIVNAQYRQPELLQNAGEEHSENNPQSASAIVNLCYAGNYFMSFLRLRADSFVCVKFLHFFQRRSSFFMVTQLVLHMKNSTSPSFQ